MMGLKIKRNDVVVVVAGKDKGKKGKVLKVFKNKNMALVEKVRLMKEFVRPNPSKNVQGGIVEKEAPIHISNLMIYCSECDRGVRVGFKMLQDGSKVRVCKKCGSIFD
ncbi:MAG: 50S ribosomal protein L24 [Candidatus Aminicenantia bacterium]